MIELWSWPTPNGQKVHIALEELALPYETIAVDIMTGEQFRSEFSAITPNHRIPALIDSDGPGGARIELFESGAILIYLAEKAGRLIPQDPASRFACLQWLMFQMSGIGPMFGQWHHFAAAAPEEIPYALERYGNEVKRLYGVLETRLAHAEYLAGDAFSIADIATFPWVRSPEKRDIDFAEFPNVARWHDAIAARPAVARGLAVLTEARP
jgi:GST-like protein